MEATITLSHKDTTILSEQLTFHSEEEAKAFVELSLAMAEALQPQSAANDTRVATRQDEPLTLRRLLCSNRVHSLAEYSAMRSRQNRCPTDGFQERGKEISVIFLIP